MHRLHAALTVVVAIKEGHSAQLRDTLKRLHRTQDRGPANFRNDETTLFVSGVILPAQQYQPLQQCQSECLPETLVFATTYCGPLSAHLNELVGINGPCLQEIFKHCVDFPSADHINDNIFKAYLKSNARPSAFGSRYQCITKKDVCREKQLRNEIQHYLYKAEKLNAFDALSAVQVKGLIQRHIRIHEDEYQWAFKPAPGISLSEFLHIWKGAALIGVFLLSVILILTLLIRLITGCPYGCAVITTILLLAAGSITLLWLIARDNNPTASRPDDAYVRKIAASQLHPILNEMTAAVPLKPGKLRKWFYATALRFLGIFRNSLPVPTVSSIRWLVIDKKRRLVFLSNYSNTTDFYVRDFLNSKSTYQGINFMFTNGTLFPDADLLFLGGISKDPEGYMNAVHKGQHVTDFWYRHEPTLTQDIIHKFRLIRNGLFKEMNEAEAAQWLKLL